jgi:hypothetical protein
VGLLMRGIEMSEISLHVHIVPDPTISVHTCANRLRAQAVWHRQRCASLLELALLAAVLVNRIKHSPLPWWLPVCREVAEIPAPAQLAHMRSWRTRLRCHSPSKARLPCLLQQKTCKVGSSGLRSCQLCPPLARRAHPPPTQPITWRCSLPSSYTIGGAWYTRLGRGGLPATCHHRHHHHRHHHHHPVH